ncbi:MAG: serine--tRNA ligase [Actinomycetota bacterium]|nr:serine--tRNA ligase [Actinomycetota bacterium]
MIDLRAARSDPEGFRAALARKGAGEAFDELLAADERWRKLVPRVDELRGRQKISGKPTPEQRDELKRVKDELRRLEEELGAAEAERDELLLRVPNPPHESVPDGETEEEAVEVRRGGEVRNFADPKDHLELGRFEMERAARVSGSRFGFFLGDTARLALAVYRLALDRLVAAGLTAALPPVLVRDVAMYGTGWFPTEESNIYAVAGDDLYLVGTSEVPLGGLHMHEIVDEEALPLRYVGFSTCFRREAGAAGKDTRGMFRVHQFNKVEQFVLCRPEDSWDEHERLLARTEDIVRLLGLPYRVVTLPAGDMSAASAKTYDLELWFPAQGRYREAASISNTTDFQARRLQIRFRGARGAEPVHTLNGTAVTDRFALAILENYQREDGSVEVPEPLVELGAPSVARR